MTLEFRLGFLSFLVAGAIALATLWKAKGAISRWSFGIGMALLALESLFSGLAALAILPDKVVFWESLAFSTAAFLPAVWLVFSLTYARGNKAEFLKKWRNWLAAILILPPALCVVFRHQLLFAVAQSEGTWLLRIGVAGFALSLLLLVASVVVLMNLETTFRASVGTMRWRIKFMVLGLAVLFAVRAYTCTQLLLFHSISLARNDLNFAALVIGSLLVLRSLFRAGHFELAVYPSQSVLYNSVTLFLAGAYLIIVGVLAKVVSFLGGDASFELKAFLVLIALVLLAVLLLSDHVRLFMKRFASRHFQRPLYDYRTVWRVFTEGTTRRVEQKDLCNAVAKLVSDVFEALSVTIWLVDETKQQLTMGASTSFAQSDSGRLDLSPEETGRLIDGFTAKPEPLDVDSSMEPWSAPLKRAHPGEFAWGGHRLCVPMIAGGELLGLMILGDRVGGAPFSVQDFDLLKCASNQAAAGLLNGQLAHRLSQSKQLEAFQAMSAFFVHDLKNTASTLSLMLQNLPVHYQDPQFREDALRGISKTVTHINEIISRLTVLRHDLTIKAIECDLNELIAEALNGHEQTAGVQFEKKLQTLPKVWLDPVQMQKVLTNLVLNAKEAMPSGGRIFIETSQRDGWAVVTVADTGCGMSREFIQSALFRPFNTTKKSGIGIGMFHSKMIVEAHRGRIDVESNEGKGTIFRVSLPLQLNGPVKAPQISRSSL